MIPINLNLKRFLSYFCSTLIIISINSPGAFSQIKERNILANEATSIDLGCEGYTAKTFSSRRYEIWTMQSGYHNLPVINGTDQKDGADFKAMNTSFSANDKKVVFSTDIAGVYPKEAMVKSWIRNYTLNRGKSFVVQGIQSWRAPEHIVEKLEKEKSGFNYTEVKVPKFTLPEILTSNNREKITSPELWNTLRRPEIIELFRKYMFGRIPETQYQKKFKVVSLDSHALGGTATQKEVDITIETIGKSLTFHLTLFTPNNAKKAVPAFLLIDPWLSDIDSPHWKQKDEYWPVKEALKRGYGMAVFNSSDLDPDNFDNFKNGIHGLLDQKVRPDDAWGTLAAWAWGASRCMDYLVIDKDVASDKVAIVGHSRAGKTALWAGAEDTRFALVVSNESGAGGAALARRRYGETVARLNSSFPHWFCSNYNKYSNNEDSLPVDMHMLLSLIAPRALYVDCADEDLWGDPKGSYMSLYNAIPVFNLLSRNSDIPESMPQLNKQVISGRVAFHIRDGAHNLLLIDWNWFMDFADKVLK